MELPNPQPPQEENLPGRQAKPTTGKRSTRSQVAPQWSLEELLFLVQEVSTMRTLSSYQKWKIISENCTSLGIARTLNQCRQQWELLLGQYNAIKNWEARTGGSYWTLGAQAIAEFELPLSFDKELFIFVDDNVSVKEKEKEKKEKEKEKEKEKDNGPAMGIATDADLTAILDSGLKKKRRSQRPRISKNEEQQEITTKLREQAEQIHAILNGNTEGNTLNEFNGPRPGETEVEFKRRQADELIKVLGSLASNIDQLSDLIKG